MSRVKNFFSLVETIFNSRRLRTILAALFFVVGLFGYLFYLFEPDIKNYGDGLWFALVTITTVGYGDIELTTTIGRVIASALMLSGLGLVATITAIVSAKFITNYVDSHTNDDVLEKLKELETEIEKLKDPFNQSGLSEVDTKKISQIQSELDEKLKEVYANLDAWQTTLVARHEDRPHSKFFIDNLFEDFIPLSGDRHYGEDNSVLTGFAKFEGQSVLVIGQEKGDDLDSRIKRNFGMMRPEGYRKTIRLMELANKFNLPIISFIDTPGAYPLNE